MAHAFHVALPTGNQEVPPRRENGGKAMMYSKSAARIATAISIPPTKRPRTLLSVPAHTEMGHPPRLTDQIQKVFRLGS